MPPAPAAPARTPGLTLMLAVQGRPLATHSLGWPLLPGWQWAQNRLYDSLGEEQGSAAGRAAAIAWVGAGGGRRARPGLPHQ